MRATCSSCHPCCTTDPLVLASSCTCSEINLTGVRGAPEMARCMIHGHWGVKYPFLVAVTSYIGSAVPNGFRLCVLRISWQETADELQRCCPNIQSQTQNKTTKNYCCVRCLDVPQSHGVYLFWKKINEAFVFVGHQQQETAFCWVLFSLCSP